MYKITTQRHCTEFTVNGDLYAAFFLWGVSFRFKSSNNLKSCSEGMNDPVFP